MTLNRTEAARIEVDNALTADGQGIPVKVISGGGGGIGGDASAANQATEIAKLTSIDGKLPAALGGAGGLKVEVVASTGGGLTDTELRATPVPVSAAALPLPAGAATSGNQTTEITRLDSLLTELQQKLEPNDPVIVSASALPAGSATAARQDTGNASLASIDGKDFATQATLALVKTAVEKIDDFISGARGLVTEDNSAAIKTAVEKIDDFISGARGLVTEDNSAAILVKLGDLLTELGQKLEPADLTGLATSAKQDTGNTSLASIDAKIPSLGQAAMSASIPVTIAYDQADFEARIDRRAQEDVSLELADMGSTALATRSRYERVSLTDRRGRTTRGSSR